MYDYLDLIEILNCRCGVEQSNRYLYNFIIFISTFTGHHSVSIELSYILSVISVYLMLMPSSIIIKNKNISLAKLLYNCEISYHIYIYISD